MNNKILINKMRDNAELAQAAYGYFHFIGKEFEGEDIKNTNRKNNPTITFYDILDMTYRNHRVQDTGLIFNDKLKGNFTPTQTKRFFERYDLVEHCPNTDSGFSATLFQNKETKEYTLAIRGTEPSDTGDLKTDARMALGYIPQGQYNDMLSFYNQCKAKYPAMTESKSLNIVGHSLGGALAQMLALSICDDSNEANINEVYTFNSHLESKKAV
ncbi:hypothetical protein XJ32_02960 [Helicobacter bilis]|uniref:Uncharacterized protein n=1 Tax=Helicobacter bilis TaxID=37372 RepID=A0A1Q2LFL5_9HELI|nr:Mbeg1-like protein [Helicobacter bilis]AQQ59229.1 hypothetical protein XJ32_02960 [Helicobacter bilis]